MLAAGRIHPVNGPRYQALKNFLPNHEHDELPCTKWLPSEEHADWMIENRLELFLVSDNFTNGAVVIWRAHLPGDPVWITIAAVGTAELEVFLAPERHAAVATVAGSNVDFGLVEKFQRITRGFLFWAAGGSPSGCIRTEMGL